MTTPFSRVDDGSVTNNNVSSVPIMNRPVAAVSQIPGQGEDGLATLPSAKNLLKSVDLFEKGSDETSSSSGSGKCGE